MAEETNQTPSISSESSAAPAKPMRSLSRRAFKLYNGFRSLLENNNRSLSPRNRSIFHRDVEREDLQCAGGHCLSSYYSVFVARLAMMVCESTSNFVGEFMNLYHIFFIVSCSAR